MNGRDLGSFDRLPRGGADAWDLDNAGQILTDEFFGVAPPAGLSAVRFNSAADLLAMPAAATPAASGDWTVSGWFFLSNDRNAITAFWSLDALFSSAWHSLRCTADGTTLFFNDTGTDLISIQNLTVNTWYFATVRKSAANAIKVYLGTEAGGALSTFTGTSSSIASYADNGYVGGNAYGDFLDGRIARMRVWNALLSDAEVDAEFTSATPVRTSNLLAAWNLDNASTPGLDSSGNARNLTNTGGSYTVETGPTIPGGAPSPQTITATGATITVTEGSPTVTPGAVSVSPNGAAITVTPGSATVTSLVTISTNGAPITVTPGAATITPGGVSVSPNGFPITFTSGAATVTGSGGSPQTVTANGFAVTLTPGAAVITPGPVSVAPNGLAITVTEGAPTVTPGTATIAPAGLAVTVTEGSATVTPGPVSVSAVGLALALTPGSAQVQSVSSVAPLGFAITLVIGSSVVFVPTADRTIEVNGKVIGLVFGGPVVFVPGSPWTLAPIRTTFPTGRPGPFSWPFRSTPPKGRR